MPSQLIFQSLQEQKDRPNRAPVIEYSEGCSEPAMERGVHRRAVLQEAHKRDHVRCPRKGNKV